MGYRIQYEQTAVKQILRDNTGNQGSTMLVKWIAIGCVLLAIAILGKVGCLDFLIPGDKEVTKQAFASMVEDVRHGEHIQTAITAFCMEIISGAGISS